MFTFEVCDSWFEEPALSLVESPTIMLLGYREHALSCYETEVMYLTLTALSTWAVQYTSYPGRLHCVYTTAGSRPTTCDRFRSDTSVRSWLMLARTNQNGELTVITGCYFLFDHFLWQWLSNDILVPHIWLTAWGTTDYRVSGNAVQ